MLHHACSPNFPPDLCAPAYGPFVLLAQVTPFCLNWIKGKEMRVEVFVANG
jgi:hypothetical protein